MYRFLASALMALCACSGRDERTDSFEVIVSAVDQRGRNVPGAQIYLDGRALSTLEDGTVPATVLRAEGEQFDVRTVCPEDYHESPAGRRLTLRRQFDLSTGLPAPLRVRFLCRAKNVSMTLIVRAGIGGLPIAVDGDVRGMTNTHGVTHLRVTHRPGHRTRVSIDTSGEPMLRPQNPALHFSVSERSLLAVFDQQFTRASPARRRHSPRRGVKNSVPQKISRGP